MLELRLAGRMSRLGTETAFEVLNRARALEKLGRIDDARSERERFSELKKAQPANAGMATGRDQ